MFMLLFDHSVTFITGPVKVKISEEVKHVTEHELETARKDAQAAYHREWRRKNPDKVREINRRYWLKRALRNSTVNGGGETDEGK